MPLKLAFYQELQQRLTDLSHFPRLRTTLGWEAYAWSMAPQTTTALQPPLPEAKVAKPPALQGMEAVRHSVQQAFLLAKQTVSDPPQQVGKTLAAYYLYLAR